MKKPALSRRMLFGIFTISGFSGLIYESIWSHYLKLFLGHAAYAQTLVLAIFMGGMAFGAWLVARNTARIKNLLVAYAVVEADHRHPGPGVSQGVRRVPGVLLRHRDSGHGQRGVDRGVQVGTRRRSDPAAVHLVRHHVPAHQQRRHPPLSRKVRRNAGDALFHQQPGRGPGRPRQRFLADRGRGVARHRDDGGCTQRASCAVRLGDGAR